MAPEGVKSNKRKGAAEAAPKPKKQKKSDATAAANKASAKALNAAAKPLDDVAPPAKVSKGSRKRAEDFFEEDDAAANTGATKPSKSKKKGKASAEISGDAEVASVKEQSKKGKKSKPVATEEATELAAPEAVKEEKSKPKKAKDADATKAVEEAEAEVKDWLPPAVEHTPTKKGKAAKKQKEQPKEPSPEVAEEQSEDNEDDVDDQTAALLAGFESDRDESDLEKEDEDISEEELKAKIPKKLSKELKMASGNEAEPGVIYIGRIPHGFFESQMKGYFSQFGKINKLRLSRNKKTGASKHYAFIEFASAEVAEIVAKTMHNYLMFGRILQCKVVPPEQVHADLFKGANQRFKVIPRNKIAGAQMARGATRDVWEKRVESETKRRNQKNKKVAEKLGYEYEAPALKTVDQVPKQALALEDPSAQQLLLEAPAEDVTGSVLTIESKPDQLTITETKKMKKGKKGVQQVVEDEVVIEQTVAEYEPEPVVEAKPKSKQNKKRKSDATAETNVEEPVVEDPVQIAPKSKKAKKGAKANGVDEDVGTEKKRKAAPAEQTDATITAKPRKAKKAKA